MREHTIIEIKEHINGYTVVGNNYADGPIFDSIHETRLEALHLVLDWLEIEIELAKLKGV